MKRFLFLWAVVLIGVVCTSWITGCRDDVVVPFPPDVRGDYTGIYSMRVEGPNDAFDSLREQLITFRFTQTTYTMFMDAGIDEADRVFCDVLGDYELGTGVAMETTDSNLTQGLCNQNWVPYGAFSLDQTSDTTRLTQVITDSVGNVTTTLLKLVRKVI